jgi:hypothetical protein
MNSSMLFLWRPGSMWVFEDLDLSLVEALWRTKSQFDAARQEAKASDKTAAPGRKRKYDKTPW